MRKSTAGTEFITVVVGLFVALFILVAVVACNGGSGGGNTYYYPQDTSHGYYDTHHHYHYYPKYDRHSRLYVKPRSGGFGVKVKPAPKSGGWSLNKGGGSGFKKSSGGFSSRRR